MRLVGGVNEVGEVGEVDEVGEVGGVGGVCGVDGVGGVVKSANFSQHCEVQVIVRSQLPHFLE